ncbi:MAG: DUF3078 domain-containing protein [Paludibacter sp.]
MKLKVIVTIVFMIGLMHTNAQLLTSKPDSLTIQSLVNSQIIDLDSLLGNKFDSIVTPQIITSSPIAKPQKATINIKPQPLKETIGKQAFDSLIIANKNVTDITPTEFKFQTNTSSVKIDTLVLKANPFFIELVYMGLPFNFDLNTQPDFQCLFYGNKAKRLTDDCISLPKSLSPEQYIEALRRDGRNDITQKAAHLYTITFEDLPDPEGNKSKSIIGKRLEKVHFVDDDESYSRNKKFTLKSLRPNPWQHKGSALAQFSQNYVSQNWYQGGNSNLAVLGILTGQLNYDNKKSVQWENNAEWRIGFNTVAGDSLRSLSTNDDVLKVNSKLGIKAGGNWFYSGSVDFSTQFFNSYKGINSPVMKASLLTPVRFNVGFGFDYKYKKLLSLMISPVAFKYIYMSDNVGVAPNLFGIKTGENTLSEVGSSFKAVLSYAPVREIQFDSKMSFYTNYQKVEIDWELVCNMTINRFMSTRISFNPRYDNTVIEKVGEKAKLQFKQFMSVGFSHKFR